MQRLRITQNMAAVSGACLMTPRAVCAKVGGFDEGFVLAFNDVDLCLNILKAGYRVVWTPDAELYHLESKTRGYEDTPEKQLRFQREVEFMKAKWGQALEEDPAYNPNLSLESLNFELAWPPRTRKPWLA